MIKVSPFLIHLIQKCGKELSLLSQILSYKRMKMVVLLVLRGVLFFFPPMCSDSIVPNVVKY